MAQKEKINGYFEWVNEDKTAAKWVDDPNGKLQRVVVHYNFIERLLIWCGVKEGLPPYDSDYVFGTDPLNWHNQSKNAR